jgi:hypothetical protein
MGKLWGPDAVARHASTSFYGTCIALSETPGTEGLIYVGTDDGLVQVTEDGGKTWRQVEKFPGVPDRTYVTRLLASQHAEGVVYLAFDNHKNGDFAPYLLRSADAGKTWVNLKGDLPERGPVLAIAEDHLNPDLLFVGTEFALYCTLDGGRKWLRLKAGLPTIAVKDLAVQRKVDDLAVGTFGRGIYILDDYSPLRELTPQTLGREAALLPVRDAILYVPTRQFGLPGKAFLGSAFYAADNPPFGAVFTYHLKESLKSQKQKRLDLEKAAGKKDAPPPFPSRDQLRAEAEEEAPAVLLTVRDPKGRLVRTLTGPVAAGLHRVRWDLREPAPVLPKSEPKEADEDLFAARPSGPLVMPGTYTVALAKRVGGKVTPLGAAREFKVVLDPGAAKPDELEALGEFQRKVLTLERALAVTLETANSLTGRLERIKRQLDQTPGIEAMWQESVRSMELRNRNLLRVLRGDRVLEARNENTPPSVSDRVRYITRASRNSLARPTETQREAFAIASAEFERARRQLTELIDTDLRAVERALEKAGIPLPPLGP